MAVPKKKVSKARRDKRRSSVWKLDLPGMTKCPKCGEYNVNMPSFEEIFYINLITDVNMVIENIWKLIDLINASRENDTNPENN